MTTEEKITDELACMTEAQILDRLADWHDGETREPSMTREWARCWCMDSIREGHPAALVLATLRGEA
jgi:hypothetical protein